VANITSSVSSLEPSPYSTSKPPLREPIRCGAEADAHALGRHLLAKAPADFLVEATQQALAAVGEHRLHPEAVEDRGELDRDVAAADHDHAPRQPLEVKRLVGGDRVAASRDVGNRGPGAGGDEDVLRREPAAADLHGVRVCDGGAPAQDLDARERQRPLVDAVQARDFLVLVREQRRPIEARLADGPAEARGNLEVFAQVRRVGEELFRDAADVDARAAETAGFGDRHPGAVARAHPARAHAARAAADREKVEVELHAARL
jgi:hypothetical protein